MSDELLGVDISRNYDTWDEALNDLHKEHEQDSNISKVFRCLEEREKTAQEIEEELDIGHSPSSYLTDLKDEGFVYKLGPQKSPYWGAEVEEVQSDEYRTDVGKS
jgi:predicted HTH transcriptional regulator